MDTPAGREKEKINDGEDQRRFRLGKWHKLALFLITEVKELYLQKLWTCEERKKIVSHFKI